MLNGSDQLNHAIDAFSEHASARVGALFDKHGVTSVEELPYLAKHQLRRALVETAAKHFPTKNAELLANYILSSLHPVFQAALSQLSCSLERACSVVEMARGVDSAVVLAGFGLPVAPFDAGESRIIGGPSNDIDTVLTLFEGNENALVGYNVCAAPFYLLVANSIYTLSHRILHDPDFSQIKLLVERERGGQLLPDPGLKQTCWLSLLKRAPGDTIASVGVSDVDGKLKLTPIMLFAGRQVNGQPYGAPNDGYLPVPGVLLRRLIANPADSDAFWPEPSGITGSKGGWHEQQA
jgi:hypothetical protein